MNIIWKVYPNVASSNLEEKLNELARMDYDIYRLEYVDTGTNSSGTMPVAQNAPVNVYSPGYPPPPSTYGAPSITPVSSGTITTHTTRMGAWVIVACRAE